MRRRTKPIEWVEKPNGCWDCYSHSIVKGYPQIRRNNYRATVARYWYEELIGDIPQGRIVRHKCDNRLCINPEHFELGTVQENMHDKMRAGTHQAGEFHPRATLTWGKVEEIRNKRESIYKLAKEYHVSAAQISRIKRLEAWTKNEYGRSIV